MSVAVLTRDLERREHARGGGSMPAARQRLARKLGLAPGTIYNLARERLKRIDADVRARIARYAIEDLEREIADRTHELEMARQMGVAPDSDLVLRAQTVLARAQSLYSAVTGVHA